MDSQNKLYYQNSLAYINLRTGALGGERRQHHSSVILQRAAVLLTHGNYGSTRDYNPYKTNIIHSIEVLAEEMLWKLYKITTKAFTTFPKLHNRDAWTHYRHSTIPWVYNWLISGQMNLSKHLRRPHFQTISHYSVHCWPETWCNREKKQLVMKPCSMHANTACAIIVQYN